MNATLKEQLSELLLQAKAEDFSEIYDLVKAIRDVKSQVAATRYNAGDLVKFMTGKHGGVTVYGTVVRVMQKNIKVQAIVEEPVIGPPRKSITVWTVHPSFLQRAASYPAMS